MTKPQRLIAVVVGAVLSVPGVLFVSLASFDSMVRAEFESGVRTSTDGDSIVIPAVGVTVAWALMLLVVAGVTGAVLLVRRSRQNPA